MKTVEDAYREWIAQSPYTTRFFDAYAAGYAAGKVEAPQWPPSDEVLDRVAMDICDYDPAIDDRREMARSAIAAYLGREF